VQAGAIRWLEKTRRDVAFSLSMISQYQGNSTPTDLDAIEKVMQYLANTPNYKLRLGGRDETVKLFFIVDGSKKIDRAMLCTMLYLSMDSGCIEFTCRKDKNVALSSTDPEMRAILSATKTAIFCRGLLQELGFPQRGPTPIYTDSGPCILALKSISNDNETRYMIPVIAFIRQHIGEQTISIHKIRGKHNPADMGTKALPRAELQLYTKYAMHGLGMRQYNGYDDFVKVGNA
jgi:hypothetical protein